MPPTTHTGREHGSAVIEWIDDVLLMVSEGNFNYEGAVAAAAFIKQRIAQRPGPRWAVINVNLTGSLSVPEAAKPFRELSAYGGARGAGHSALINCSVVQDQVAESYYEGSGVAVRSFREIGEAVAWLHDCGYTVSLEHLLPYIPPH